MSKFLRKVSLTIQPYFSDELSNNGQGSSAQGIKLDAGGGTENPSIRVDFNIRAGVYGMSRPQASVTVFNLSKSTRGNLSQLKAPGFIFAAGYEDEGQVTASNPCVLFSGLATRITSEKQNTEFETHFTGYASEVINTRVVHSFARGCTDRQILDWILNTLGVSYAPNASYLLDSVLCPTPYATGVQIADKAKKYLAELGKGYVAPKPKNPFATTKKSPKQVFKPSTTLVNSINANAATLNPGAVGDAFDWTISNDLVFEVSIPQAASENTTVVISPDTGMINSPARFYEKAYKDLTFLRVTAALDARYQPHKAVQIISDDFKGIYRILSVEHSGSTHGSDFVSKMECMEIVGATTT